MSANHDLERRISDHYAAEAPARAPDWVLERILTSVDTTPQRRAMLGLPWRIPTMPSSAKLALTAVAIAAVGFVGLTLLRGSAIGPAAYPSPTASPLPVTQPPPFTERFDSPLHGLSIGYPSGWQPRAATQPWNHDAVNFGAPDVDVIFHPTLQDDLYFAVVSERLGGKSASDWVDASLLPSVGICTEPSSGGNGGAYTVDGAAGFAVSCGSLAAGGHAVAVATATRGYIIYLHVGDERLLQATYTWDWFKAALGTVDLRPEKALDE